MFIRYLLVIALGLVSILGATYAYWARDIAPTQSNLKEADLPPVIPFRDFFADMNAEWIYRVSPNGDKIAWHSAGFGTVNIKVSALADKENATTIKVGELQDMFWHPDGERVVVLTDGRLWAIDAAKPNRQNWEDVTPRGFQSWWIVKYAEGADKRTVIASRDRVAQAADLFTVDANGGDKRPLVQNPGDVAVWGISTKGNVVLRIRKDGDTRAIVEMRDQAEADVWNEAFSYSVRDSFFPILMNDTGDAFYALSNRGRDLLSLVEVSPETGAEKVIASANDGDIVDAFTFFIDSKIPDIVMSPTSKSPLIAVSEFGQRFLAALEQDGKALTDFDITGISQSTRKVSFRVSYDGSFWSNKLFDPKDGSIVDVGRGRFGRHDPALAKSEQVQFDARDGLSIPAILTRPKTSTDAGPLPTIINIHGGPASFEAVGYRGEDQFLANRGYVVLSVNFRGSTGYGKSFRAADYGETGGKMQDDIVDAAKWLIEAKIADPDNIAVKGGSYGGYSAALAMTRDPGLFKAAIIDYAVTDIPYQMANNPFGWGLSIDEMQRYFGDASKPEDLEAMRENSPVTHAAEVHGPLLLSHGKRDTVVGFEQTENFVRALSAAAKPFEVHYFEKEGHGYNRWQSNVVYWRKVETFLSENIGGRDGGFDYVELGPHIFGD